MGYNINGLETQTGYKKPDFVNYSFGFYYNISCVRLGVVVSRNNFTLANLPTTTVFRFKFTITGF